MWEIPALTNVVHYQPCSLSGRIAQRRRAIVPSVQTDFYYGDGTLECRSWLAATNQATYRLRSTGPG